MSGLQKPLRCSKNFIPCTQPPPIVWENLGFNHQKNEKIHTLEYPPKPHPVPDVPQG